MNPRVKAFENHYDRYEEWFEKHPHAYQSELRAIRRALPRRGTGLEIGVGSGRFADPLGIRMGVEPSARMRELAAQRGVVALPGIAEDLPFDDASFDYCLMVTTICFVDDIFKTFAEASRVLKNKGVMVNAFVDKNSPLGLEYLARKSQSVFYRDAVFYSGKEVLRAMWAAGFGSFAFYQTLFTPFERMTKPDPVKRGYGTGSFLVIRGVKQRGG